MIKISNRLNSLVKYVLEDDKVMDVGCDHALLDIYLVENGNQNKVYVSDVNPNALQNGINNIEKYDLEDKVIPILGYGIEKIRELDVDTLIISGMGSKNIVEILGSPNLDQIYKLILQSNNNHYELRKCLTEKGFNIIFEEIVNDAGKDYINIVAVRQNPVIKYSEEEYEFGPILIKNKENLEYFKSLLNTYDNILLASRSDEIRTKVRYLEDIVSTLANE